MADLWTLFWYVFLLPCLVPLVLVLCCRTVLALKTRRKLRGMKFQAPRPFVVGFFHPYCNSGGGGERVLWHAIDALQRRYEFVEIVVYTGDRNQSDDDITSKVFDRFHISMIRPVHFQRLFLRRLVEAEMWPRVTILGQSFGSVILGLEALVAFVPHVFIDSTGYAFTVPLFRWVGGSRTASYVHYPTVSTDMIHVVENSVRAFNNNTRYTTSGAWRRLKVKYYQLFAKLYGVAGRRNDVVMVNSSWTYNHIKQIWNSASLSIVYPPCDTSAFLGVPLEREGRDIRVVSIGQFRPEKKHEMQLDIMKELKRSLVSAQWRKTRLVFIGGVRNATDENKVKELKDLATQLNILDNVEFKTNISFDALREELSTATIGLHTMWNEHFGIGVVEMMAAGALVVADNSGGPKLDILRDWEGSKVGFLANDVKEYVHAITTILKMQKDERVAIATAAREAANERFSVKVFENSFLRATECLFTS